MLPAESAHDTVAALGEVGLLQFKDLNPDKSAFQRTFANQVRPRHAALRTSVSVGSSVLEVTAGVRPALLLSLCASRLTLGSRASSR